MDFNHIEALGLSQPHGMRLVNMVWFRPDVPQRRRAPNICWFRDGLAIEILLGAGIQI